MPGLPCHEGRGAAWPVRGGVPPMTRTPAAPWNNDEDHDNAWSPMARMEGKGGVEPPHSKTLRVFSWGEREPPRLEGHERMPVDPEMLQKIQVVSDVLGDFQKRACC